MSVPGPTLGPCTSWITGDDVAACCSATVSNTSDLDAVAAEASMALYEISGRQFTGLCGPRLVRPCNDPCRCWPSSSVGLPWTWSWAALPGGWGWWSECGGACGCGSLSRVKLAGYPVREIEEVKIDGQTVGASTYRLDEWRYLTRLDDPGPPVVQRSWPACQNLALPDTEPGTFSVSYYWGVDPPQLGRDAAAQVACQLYLSCKNDGRCVLPAGATKVVRQGVTVERGLLANWLDPAKPTGLVAVDLFLAAYARKGRRRAAIYSPDVQGFARPIR